MNIAAKTKSTSDLIAETVGKPISSIPVEISTRFLEHFSEQLYSSPQKAFEELISNGWDAGADFVDVRVPADLSGPTASLSVFDNGASMDATGLQELWHIAFSPKRDHPIQHGRQVVGKFGIGKLATYVLASKLTYICKAEDGVIRRVTMDYGDIDRQAKADKLVSDLSLELFELTDAELEKALHSITHGADTAKLILDGPTEDTEEKIAPEDEFGAPKTKLSRQTRNTWTLVILSNLKPTGRDLKIGVLRRMLEAALPLSSEMRISINGTQLTSSKLATTVAKSWVIGKDLGFTEIELDLETDTKHSDTTTKATEKIVFSVGEDGLPSIDIPDIGRVTGRVVLYDDKISGGKSEERGTSNGFYVNVLGRVVNQSDPSFGAENLSHAAWSRFRMTVRADGLNNFLNTNREQFREQRALKVFRSFLRRCFNLARSFFDSDGRAEMPDGGDVLVRSLGVVSLAPLRSAVSEALRTQPPIPGLFDETGIKDREQKRTDWRVNTADHIQNALSTVKYEKTDDESFVKFRINDNTIVINKDHPFVAEHSRTRAEKELMRTVAMVSLLSDIYALEAGIDAAKVQSLRDYRDQLFRFRALQRRQSGTHIAKILLASQHKSSASKELEAVVADALRYLGFHVKELGKAGDPEGVASAVVFSHSQVPTDDDPEPPLYRFTYDAKSTKHDAAKTGNVSLDAINEHRIRYKADYALVVAPGYEQGSLSTRCAQLKITPLKAYDLGRLLEYTVEYGAIPLDKLRGIFDFHSPEQTSGWIDELQSHLRKSRKLTIDVFLKALEALKGKVPDALAPSMISFTCRTVLNVATVVDQDVINLVKGLSILVPDLIGIDEKDRIIINASSSRVAAAVEAQLEKLHEEAPELEGLL